MTASEPADPQRFRLLASFVAGTPVDIAVAGAGDAAHTDGQRIFVSADGSPERHRREVLVQSALLGAGSLARPVMSRLRARPSATRRFLTLEGNRALSGLAPRMPLAAAVRPDLGRITADAGESLEIALGRYRVVDPPAWFGMIKPARLLTAMTGAGTTATDRDLRLSFTDDRSSDDDGDDAPPERSKILKLFEAPAGAQPTANFLRKLFSGSRSPGSEDAGAESSVGALRRATSASTVARPVPTPIRFTDAERPGASVGVGGALYPEWDVFANRYRADWCRVLSFPVTTTAEVADAGVHRDDVLRRRLSRVRLGPKVLRARADGDELDTDALIDLFVDLRSGHSPPEHVYTERRTLSRDLGVLILLDASGSATDADPGGLAVHEHQRRAAATLAATLDELGDRVAVYAFRSHGRRAVHLPAIKTFGQRFSALTLTRLNELRPSGYTRLGAGIRGAGEILQRDAGTPNRMLVVLSDGYPYDDGYEGRYAEADARKALEELRAVGVGCLCLSIGSAADTESLDRVFGSASHAGAATLAELSPRMDELFLTALRELSAPRRARVYASPVNHK